MYIANVQQMNKLYKLAMLCIDFRFNKTIANTIISKVGGTALNN